MLVDGEWGIWDEWTDCSEECGVGEQTRSRQCNDPAPVGDGQTVWEEVLRRNLAILSAVQVRINDNHNSAVQINWDTCELRRHFAHFYWRHPCLTSKCILFVKNIIIFCNLFGRGVYVDVTLSINIQL